MLLTTFYPTFSPESSSNQANVIVGLCKILKEEDFNHPFRFLGGKYSYDICLIESIYLADESDYNYWFSII